MSENFERMLAIGCRYLGEHDHFITDLCSSYCRRGLPEVRPADVGCRWAWAWSALTCWVWLIGGLEYAICFLLIGGNQMGAERVMEQVFYWTVCYPAAAFTVVGLICRPSIALPCLVVNFAALWRIVWPIMRFVLVCLGLTLIWVKLENLLEHHNKQR